MSDRDARRLTLLCAAVTGFFSGVARAVTAWVIRHCVDR